MYGKALSGLIVVIVIALGVGLFVWQSSKQDGKEYKNSVYGYTLTYPATLSAREYSDDNAVFGIITKDAVDAHAEVRVITAQGEAGQTAEDAVAMQLQNLCAADGPDASFSCTGTLSTEPFATENGDAGFVLMLKGELKDLKSGSITTVPKGPYYVLTIASSATISKVVVVSPPLNTTAAEADTALIRSMAESLYLSK